MNRLDFLTKEADGAKAKTVGAKRRAKENFIVRN
jgi:hypothetical protein